MYERFNATSPADELRKLFLFLEDRFIDGSVKIRVVSRLSNLKLGKLCVPGFLAEFDQLIVEFGGQTWHDALMIAFPRNAPTDKILWEMGTRSE
ncbi:hypothetical protein CFIMG_007928RA00001 [Ceratocystis fimbriata CBS 114723]|uniref:Uncharacterized protein n=1 Tax=Ceratocystis fimbriata CBS 114723 TaxID=1035309 RepID=A0A2C5WRL2_9PEZI|nr:hypothetical protein CFIMG_007928RA00001 [Ceratocystis fimbriata CBS 114723]